MDQKYTASQIELDLFQLWEKNNLFIPTDKELKNKESYLIFMPPPNVTNVLHLGHALNNTIQDVVARYYRMNGRAVVWKAGVDHAGIATENMVEKHLRSQGVAKKSLTPEEFIKHVWEWKAEYGNIIIEQLKRLGSSADWENIRFTMDDISQEAVQKIFIMLYEDGLIYRSEYIVNWCVSCLTALSDEEVENEPSEGYLFYLKYQLENEESELIVATTRPETIFGDVAIAVHPDDERYQKFIGKNCTIPLVNRSIPIIADTRVEKDFGTGVLKITPSHDTLDFQIGETHNLPFIEVLDTQGILNSKALHYEGLDRFTVRKKIASELEEYDLLLKQEKHHNVKGVCYRCKNIIEKRVSKQWFLKMKELAKPALDVIHKKELRFTPSKWEKVYVHWLENIQDWCISRQILWGHSIPALYCNQCQHIHITTSLIQECEKCSSTSLNKETDVLDTWFSSWIWPLTVLGWPEQNNQLDSLYPGQFLATAPEIIFFWVARMIMLGLYVEKKIPFNEVFFNPTICDKKGLKMSKSLGNGIDPLDIIDKYGADTLRYTLLYLAPKGDRIRLDKDMFEIGYKFVNKLWNASRFVLSMEGMAVVSLDEVQKDDWDIFILKELNSIIEKTHENQKNFDFHKLTHDLYHFFWNNLCDWYIESAKLKLNNAQPQEIRNSKYSVIIYVLEKVLKLLHPIIPFITEYVWQKLPLQNDTISVMISKYPVQNSISPVSDSIHLIKEIIYKVRNLKADLKVTRSQDINVSIYAEEQKSKDIIFQNQKEVQLLSKVDSVAVLFELESFSNTLIFAETHYILYVHLLDTFDFQNQRKRIEKEIQVTESEINRAMRLIKNDNFIKKASEELVEEEKQKHKDYTLKRERLESLLAQL